MNTNIPMKMSFTTLVVGSTSFSEAIVLLVYNNSLVLLLLLLTDAVLAAEGQFSVVPVDPFDDTLVDREPPFLSS